MPEFFVDFFYIGFEMKHRAVRAIQVEWAMATSATGSKVSHMLMFDCFFLLKRPRAW